MRKIMLLLMIFSINKKMIAQIKNTDQQKVAALLNKMTLEEKIGQMTQVTLGVVSTPKDGVLDTDKLKKAVVDHKVGSVLNVTGHALTLDEWKKLITQVQDEAKKTRLQIPVLYGLDAIHGQTYTLGSTLFPQNIALAASRNTDIVRAVTKVTAKELRASGVRWNFAPVLDCGRQPLWARFPETYGEDVYLGKTMGATAVKAYEEDGLKNPTAVASCMKHYLGYSASRTGKDRTPIYLPENELREYYLPQFAAAIKAGASSIMINGSEINGVPVHASKYLLTEVLRKELGFEGVIDSDWEDIIRLYTRHHVAATPLDAVVQGVNAGIDMSMVPNDFSFYDLLLEAVQKKMVSIVRINDAVTRILTMKMKLGLFDDPYPELAAEANFGKTSYQDIALDAARESMTLLKNSNGILPLKKTTKILVAGPAAQTISGLNGAWSYTWQGKDEQWYPSDSKTIYESIVDKVGAANVITSSVKGFENAQNVDVEKMKAAAINTDVIILCLGENAYAESPGNTSDLALPENQRLLAEAAVKTGKPVILLLTEGRPLFITGIEPTMKAILMAYWSGKKTGEAIADVLFGDYNPSGRLPFSYSKSMGEMVMYDRKPSEDIREIFNENVLMNGYDPLYTFGWGLSYTTFDYSDIKLSSSILKANDKLVVSITIKNNGTMDGKHSVELYTHDIYASITPNMKRLRAFQKIFLKAGESKELSFTIDKNDLAFVNAGLKTVTEPGAFEIMIGDKKTTFTYEQ
ncbi:MAG: glycoside hydrolase family 3 N-terminal domain-containing protein [Ferruginibacter sp.]